MGRDNARARRAQELLARKEVEAIAKAAAAKSPAEQALWRDIARTWRELAARLERGDDVI